MVCDGQLGEVGLNLQFRDHGTNSLYDDNSRHLERFSELEVDYVRFVISPYTNSDGTYDEETTIREYQNQINALCARGIDSVVVVNQQLVPELSRQWNEGNPDFGSLRPVFESRVDVLAQNFGTTVNFWEIWNEPDIDPYFRSTTQTVLDDLTTLVNDTRQQILNGNSSAQIIFGGLSNTWRGAGRGYTYWSTILALNENTPQHNYLDIHPYTFGNDGLSEETRSVDPAIYFYLNQNVTAPPTPSDDCVIPPSGAWPECAKGGGTPTRHRGNHAQVMGHGLKGVFHLVGEGRILTHQQEHPAPAQVRIRGRPDVSLSHQGMANRVLRKGHGQQGVFQVGSPMNYQYVQRAIS